MADKIKSAALESYKTSLRKQRLAVSVRTIRNEKGMSLNELAEKTGYDTSTIGRIENGTFLPDKDKGKDIAIANALGISLNQLWGRKKIELFDSGLAKLTEYEKTALTLIAPMLREMSDDGQRYLIDTALLILKAEGKTVQWDEYNPTSKK